MVSLTGNFIRNACMFIQFSHQNIMGQQHNAEYQVKSLS